MICLEHLILFHLFDYCWEKFNVNDDLPALLGEMSPYLFTDGIPIDNSVYDDWDRNQSDITDNRDRIERMVRLLALYEKKYHFNFDETKRVLKRITDNDIARIIGHCKKLQNDN